MNGLLIESAQTAAIVLLSVAGCFQHFRVRRLAVAAAYAKAEAALAHGQIALLQSESDMRKNASALRAIASAGGRSNDTKSGPDRLVRLECLQMVVGSYHPVDEHRLTVDEQVAAADLLARFVMEGPNA